MNAKKAKQIRRMARMLAEQTAQQDPSVYNQEPQVVDKNGAVVNTIASVRGVYPSFEMKTPAFMPGMKRA